MAAEPGNTDQSESDDDDKDDDKKDDAKPATPAAPAQPAAPALPGQPAQPGKQPQYFYMPNAQGQMTLMKTITPGTNGATGTPAAGNEKAKEGSKWQI